MNVIEHLKLAPNRYEFIIIGKETRPDYNRAIYQYMEFCQKASFSTVASDVYPQKLLENPEDVVRMKLVISRGHFFSDKN